MSETDFTDSAALAADMECAAEYQVCDTEELGYIQVVDVPDDQEGPDHMTAGAGAIIRCIRRGQKWICKVVDKPKIVKPAKPKVPPKPTPRLGDKVAGECLAKAIAQAAETCWNPRCDLDPDSCASIICLHLQTCLDEGGSGKKASEIFAELCAVARD